MATSDVLTAKETPDQKPSVPTPATPAPAGVEPRNFLAAFMLTMLAGPLGLRHFYLGDKKLGWVRTGLFVGGYAWSLIMALLGQGVLGFLGFVAVAVAGIWSIVDFFYVYIAVKTDADGNALAATARDRKWARSFFLAAIIGFIAVVVLSIAAGIFVEQQLKNGNWRPTNTRNYDPYNSQNPSFEEYMKQLQNQSDSSAPSY